MQVFEGFPAARAEKDGRDKSCRSSSKGLPKAPSSAWHGPSPQETGGNRHSADFQ
jgi:hypothetical protein